MFYDSHIDKQARKKVIKVAEMLGKHGVCSYNWCFGCHKNWRLNGFKPQPSVGLPVLLQNKYSKSERSNSAFEECKREADPFH